MKQSLLLIVLGFCSCVTAGCSFLRPQPDRTRYFILSPTVDFGSGSITPASVPASGSRLSIGVGPIKFPDYLKRPWIVTRIASNRLIVSDVNRWAEPLDQNFETTLCQNLSSMLRTQKIVTYPWYADTHVDYQIAVWVSRFETSEDGRSQLSAEWTIYSQNGNELATGQSDLSAPVQAGDNEASAALSRDLADLSRQIAERTAQLNVLKNASVPIAVSTHEPRG